MVVVVPSKDKRIRQGQRDLEVVDTIKVMLPIPDSLMWKNDKVKKRISATLLKDKLGLVVRMPSMASAMVYGTDLIYRQEAEVDESAKTNHETLAAYYHNHKEVEHKEVTFLFPQNMKGSNRHFNGVHGDPESRKLLTQFRFGNVELKHRDENGVRIRLPCPFVFWEIVVEGPHRTIHMENESDSDEDEAFVRMLAASAVLDAEQQTGIDEETEE